MVSSVSNGADQKPYVAYQRKTKLIEVPRYVSMELRHYMQIDKNMREFKTQKRELMERKQKLVNEIEDLEEISNGTMTPVEFYDEYIQLDLLNKKIGNLEASYCKVASLHSILLNCVLAEPRLFAKDDEESGVVYALKRYHNWHGEVVIPDDRSDKDTAIAWLRQNHMSYQVGFLSKKRRRESA